MNCPTTSGVRRSPHDCPSVCAEWAMIDSGAYGHGRQDRAYIDQCTEDPRKLEATALYLLNATGYTDGDFRRCRPSPHERTL